MIGASRAISSLVCSWMLRTPRTVGVFKSVTPATYTAVMARAVATGATT